MTPPATSVSQSPAALVHWLSGAPALTGCFLAGEALRGLLGLKVPGNMLGLFLLLTLLGVGVVKLRHVEAAAGTLLGVLPLLFVPLFVGAAEDRRFWAERGTLFAAAILAGLLALWAIVGHLAQWLLARSPGGTDDPGPWTEAEQEERRATAAAPVAAPLRPASAATTATTTTGEGVRTTALTAILLTAAAAVVPGTGGTAAATALLVAAGWSVLTIVVYFAARAVFLRLRSPLLHPMFTALLGLVLVVEWTGRRYAEYRDATAWIPWLLGPAVVAMAVPVWRLRTLLLARLPLLGAVIGTGSVFGFGSMALLLRWLGQPREVVAAATLKGLTSPVAIELGRQIGARPDALAAAVMLAGASGAIFGPSLLRAIGIHDRRARGLAMGCGSHGIGVARALEVDKVCGAFATLGMTGSAMLGAVLFPYLARWWLG